MSEHRVRGWWRGVGFHPPRTSRDKAGEGWKGFGGAVAAAWPGCAVCRVVPVSGGGGPQWVILGFRHSLCQVRHTLSQRQFDRRHRSPAASGRASPSGLPDRDTGRARNEQAPVVNCGWICLLLVLALMYLTNEALSATGPSGAKNRKRKQHDAPGLTMS